MIQILLKILLRYPLQLSHLKLFLNLELYANKGAKNKNDTHIHFKYKSVTFRVKNSCHPVPIQENG